MRSSRNTVPEAWIGAALTIGLGAFGGATFFALGLPLPWMLGAMAATLIAALSKAPLRSPERIRPVVVAVIGVMLGSGFTPDTFSQLGQWALSLMGLLACVAVSAVAVSVYFVRVGRMDPVTAMFASMPGGLVEMMEVGRQYGGDDRAIILAHAARIVLVIAIMAFWFRIVLGLEVSGVAPLGKGPTGPLDILILVVCGSVGAAIGLNARLPAPTFLGPMLVSAGAHMVGLTEGSPPTGLVICAQVVMGTIVGCRFIGLPAARVLRAFALSVGATLLMLTIALAFASGLHGVLGQSAEQVLLAYAPGGLTEMSLVALSMGGDVAYIATHHLVRVVTLLAVAGALLGRIAQWLVSQQASPRSCK